MAYLGVIEGFYGRSWGDERRRALAGFLRDSGYRFYIYAPKEDRTLRTRSFAPLPPGSLAQLRELCAHYQGLGLDFGLGLSPLGLSGSYPEQRAEFLAYARTLQAEVAPDLFCLLFDDMKLCGEDMGARQRRIIEDLAAQLGGGQRLIVCPSYYSLDPVLDRVFGPRPAAYFQELLAGLDERIDVFWTGPQVLSPDLTPADLEQAAALLGRQPFIWDNYPVNDGRRISRFIRLRPFRGRTGLEGLCRGHAVNPMLEFELSQIPLCTLPLIYAGAGRPAVEQAWREAFARRLGTFDDPERVCRLLCDLGLDQLQDGDIAYLRAHSDPAQGCGREILDFLSGVYAFDPACLTDT